MDPARRRLLLARGARPCGINIASLIVKARPENLPFVRDSLIGMEGVEITHDAGDGRLIVIVDATTGGTAIETLTRIHTLRGVVSACLTYHYSDDTLETFTTPEKPS